MDSNSNFIIANKYKITQCIGNGTFGCVYKGTHIKNNNTVAIKLEDKRTSYKLLKRETSIMKYLYEHQCRNIPSIYWFGSVNNYMGLVIPFYDCSLLQYREIKSISDQKIKTLSMGMSGDYKIAIKEGSNMVRIGSLIFGERD